MTFTTEWKNKAFISGGKKCLCCGATKGLSIHHIIPKSKGGKNGQENLATLCHGCHTAYHSKFEKTCWSIETYWKKWGEYISGGFIEAKKEMCKKYMADAAKAMALAAKFM